MGTLRRFVQSVVRYHPFTAFLIGPSLEKPRVLRFLSLFLSILLSLFITTIIFQVYFPPNNGCSNFNNTSAFECLQEESGILRGQALCEWNADKRICKLRPPPDSASFIIATAVLTAIVFAPLDLFFYVILNLICNQRPKLESIGLDSFYWLGGDMEAASEIAKAVSYVLRAIKGFETALAIGQCSEDELIRVITILGKIGLQIRANKV